MGKALRRTAALAFALLGGILVAPPAAHASETGTVRVPAAHKLNVRSGPSLEHSVVRRVRGGEKLAVACQTVGQKISGSLGTSSLWNRLTDGRYVSDAYVAWGDGRPPVPACGAAPSARVQGWLNLRGNTSTLLGPVGTIRADAPLSITCQLGGERIEGQTRTSELWDRQADGTFVADANVTWPDGRPSIPWCSLAADGPPAGTGPFVDWAAGHAQQMKARYNVPASVTIAQAILESGWGKSGLTRDGNSYFGMKCFGGPSSIATGCRPYSTSECAGGCFATTATFRVYSSASASFEDHSKSFATLARYREALNVAHDPDRFAVEIHKAGYATSPTYAQTLIGLMREYDLYRFDRPR